jgi:predicted nuclease of predicted toxin-antitoxin system
MRVLLDAHLSGRSIGDPLRAAGHDVLALDDDLTLKQLPDDDVLDLAIEQGRIVVTANIRDFARLARSRLEAGQHHPGIVLIPPGSLAFGVVLRGLARLFADHPDTTRWVNRVEFLG